MSTIMLFSMPGGWEMVIIVLVILLLFGAKRIPELAKGLGKGIREFKDATREIKNDIDKAGDNHSTASNAAANPAATNTTTTTTATPEKENLK